MEVTKEKFLELVKTYQLDSLEKVKKAYALAEYLHKDQFRESGEEYINHPLNVAYILAEMHADSDTLCAALLHDTLEDTKITKEEIEENFNSDVANLVDGVTKLAKMNFATKEEQNLANTRKIITGLSNDVRIIIIKLADRLHNMRTLQYKRAFKQKENSLETLELFVPLAYSLGAYRIKSELEDLSLKYLKPGVYKQIAQKQELIAEHSMPFLQEMLLKIQEILTCNGVNSEIKIRTKNIYGIYKKLEEGYKLSNIHDLLALKIMVDELYDCYISLGLIHHLYHPMNSKFKDYICNPKTNMYQSLHTTVFGPNGELVQTQIRTYEMDKIASFGLTSYFDIESDDARVKMQKALKDKFQFFTSLVDIDSTFKNNRDFVREVKKEVFADKVYVYTPKGEVIELPKGSTVIDFAYKIHSDIGNTMIGAIVNDADVPLSYVLQNKDRVKVITDKLISTPKKEWESIAQTSLARRKIREVLKSN